MEDLFVRLFHIFDKKDRAQFLFFFFGTFLTSFLEIVSIGMILPFIAILSRPSLVVTNKYLSYAYQSFHFRSTAQFMIFLAWGIIGIFICKNILLFFLSMWQSKFVYDRQSYLKTRLFRAYLMSPYHYHLKINLAWIDYMLSSITVVMNGVVLQLFNLTTEAVLVAGLFIVLLWKYPALTLMLMVILGAMFSLYFKLTRKKLDQLSKATQEFSIGIQRQVNQGLGSIKESKLGGKEQFFYDQYCFYSQQLSLQLYKNEVISKSPRLFIETAVVVLVMFAMISCLTIGMPPEKVFIMVSIFAIVAVRLMPSLNRISTAWASIRGGMRYINNVYDELKLREQTQKPLGPQEKIVPISFENGIELKAVTFSYEGSEKPAVEKVSLFIPKNKSIGFVGPSGAGKSTVVDIVLGLLDPVEGHILVDGRNIHEHIKSWQRQIGYIPQLIYLADDTIKNNVAFGMKPEDISDENIWRALKLSQLEEFVRSLPEQLDTQIGERGIRLSGGQRQRIGIARALYNNPEILVMDEATSALDNETERDFMEALSGLAGGKTIIIIAHRLTTIQGCDKIFFLKDGRLLGEGNYKGLLENCPEFHSMAGGGHF